MKKSAIAFCIATLCVLNIRAQSITRLLAAAPQDDILRVLDTNTYATIATRTLAFTSGGPGAVIGCTGLSRKPSNGMYYILARVNSTRYLGTLNPLTGSITSLGNLNDLFSSITFNSNNTLMGTTGDGALVPETAYRIDQTTAGSSSIVAMGNGGDGEVICHNPTNNKIYHWSGNGTVFYERFDTTFATMSNVGTNGYFGEIFGAVYKTNGKFIVTNTSSQFRMVDTVGNFSAPLATYSVDLKALAYITCPRLISGNPGICGNGSTTLTMSAGGSFYQWYKNNTLIPAANGQSYSVTTPGHYNCIITDACGTDSLAQGIAVQQLNMPVVTISGSTVVCAGQTITPLVGSSGGTSQWYRNGVFIPGATSNTYTPTQPGTYNMIKTNSNGCSDSAAVGHILVIGAAPNLSVTPLSAIICLGSAVSFSASGADTYTWSHNQSTTAVITETPTSDITISYTVTGTGTNGCSNAAVAAVIVSKCTGIAGGESTATISVYPNPVKDNFTVRANTEIHLRITDNTGKIVGEVHLYAGNSFTETIRALSPGVYFLSGQSGPEIVNKKLVIVR